MHHLTESAVKVVASDTQAMLKATDQALLAHAQLLASVIEGVGQSNLSIGTSQDLFSKLMTHGGKLVESREDLRQLITRLTLVKDRSDRREVATGCPVGFPAMADETPAVAAELA